ncbi:hypothetical protein T11_11885 [Trichinella zimbabwensis]|uniref:Uncharacterized protein n=1 Tax=Trichinella zimbabwensis TaxID=268475 RepID=A0A0V1GB02_9BILA|nr:hypothetical protein T11_11885 [Trichinella zimbabwensis]
MHPLLVRSCYCYRLNWDTSGFWKMNRELERKCNSLGDRVLICTSGCPE